MGWSQGLPQDCTTNTFVGVSLGLGGSSFYACLAWTHGSSLDEMVGFALLSLISFLVSSLSQLNLRSSSLSQLLTRKGLSWESSLSPIENEWQGLRDRVAGVRKTVVGGNVDGLSVCGW